MKRFFSVFSAAVFVVVLSVGIASAATVLQLDLSQLVANSDAIVVAQVSETSAELEDDGRVYTTIEFQTHDTLKGHLPDEFALRQVGGRDGDITTHVPGMPQFFDGERVMLFLSDIDDHPVITGMSQGKLQIAQGPDGDTDFVIPQVGDNHLIEPEQDRTSSTDAPDAPSPPQLESADHSDIFDRVHRYDEFRTQVEAIIEYQSEQYR